MSKSKHYTAKRISAEQYETLLSGLVYPLYYEPWWLAEASRGRAFYIACFSGHTCVAVFACILSYGRLITPPFCQYSGIFFLAEGLSLYEKQVISQTIHKELPKHTYYEVNYPPSYTDWLGLRWLDYKQTTRYNYIWDISGITSREELLRSISSTLRKNLKASERAGFVYVSEVSVDEAMTLLRITADHKKYQSDFALQERLIIRSAERGEGQLVGLRTPDTGQLAMVSFFVRHQRVAYLIAEGNNRTLSGRYQLKTLILLHYILQEQESIDQIDFEGSMLEPIAKIYQALGATQQSYMTITKGNKYSLSSIGARLLWGQ
ncbi:MAG: hypothetical protein Q4A64_06545 [Porphyromonadaceae bacterium]|nr:hypothetical protein [Porphyromonadaceae bacterium]